MAHSPENYDESKQMKMISESEINTKMRWLHVYEQS